jgi:hypothetical protein
VRYKLVKPHDTFCRYRIWVNRDLDFQTPRCRSNPLIIIVFMELPDPGREHPIIPQSMIRR